MATERDWGFGVYAKDIHRHLCEREKRRFAIKKQSSQLCYRQELVEFIDRVCQQLHFCTTVQHLAVYLLDVFMDNHRIYINHLQMVAIGCLLVAVKLEEKDMLIPRNSEYNTLLGNKYRVVEFLKMEVAVLKFFNWDALFPTPAHFAEYYSLYALQLTDELDNPIPFDVVETYAKKYIKYYLEVTLLDLGYQNFKPSLVAAACVAASRITLNVTPNWPYFLRNLTGYEYKELQDCVISLLRTLEADMLEANRKTSEASNSPKTKGDISPTSVSSTREE